jgi:uncharacterized membrane protein YciS (DUF1049 family)
MQGAIMRLFYVIVLLVILAPVAVLAAQNSAESVEVKYLGQTARLSVPALLGATYVLGMLSGWTVLGLIGNSLRRVTGGPK